jgi:integrase
MKGPTYRDMAQRFKDTHVIHLRAARDYRRLLDQMDGFFGVTPLSGITSGMIAEYRDNRAKEVSNATTNRALGVLRKAFHCAEEWGWIMKTPTFRLLPEPPGRDKWLLREDEERLLQVAKPWLRPIIVTALYTGLRLGEIMALDWKAVDLARQTITIVRSKNGERRTIPVHPKVLGLLQERVQPEGLVFTFTKGAVSRAFCRTVRGMGLTDFRFHDLRHSFGSRLAMANVNVLKIQKLMGHKSLDMTMRYSHHSVDSLRDTLSLL